MAKSKRRYSVVTTDKYGNEKRSESMDDFYYNDYLDYVEDNGSDEGYMSPDEIDKLHGIR